MDMDNEYYLQMSKFYLDMENEFIADGIREGFLNKNKKVCSINESSDKIVVPKNWCKIQDDRGQIVAFYPGFSFAFFDAEF